MTSIVFVHGTGTRSDGLAKLVERTRDEIRRRQPGWSVTACAWGDQVGCKLHAQGVSIPTYAQTHGGVLSLDDATTDEAALLAELWNALYRDPLVELRAIAASAEVDEVRPFTSSATLEAQLRALMIAALPTAQRAAIAAAELEPTFDAGVALVRDSAAFEQALPALDETLIDVARVVLARAIVAAALVQAEAQNTYPLAFLDAAARDAAVDAVEEALGMAAPGTLGIFDTVKEQGLKVMAQALTGHLRQRRGAVMDRALGFIGDILLYQGNGQRVRELVLRSIQQATPPVVLVAHSLGGIACVDLLIKQDLRDRVALLVTVGSQAPVFYEMGALSSLPYASDAHLPPHMPPWLNIYDLQDFLSFVGAGVFAGRIKDVQVDNRQPFPHAHSAYWFNPAVWQAIVSAASDPARVLP